MEKEKYVDKERNNIVGQAIIYRYKKGSYNTARNQELVYMREGFIRMNEVPYKEWEMIMNHYFLKVVNLDEKEWEWVKERLGVKTIFYNNGCTDINERFFTD